MEVFARDLESEGGEVVCLTALYWPLVEALCRSGISTIFNKKKWVLLRGRQQTMSLQPLFFSR